MLAGQSDPLFEPASLLMTTPTPSTEVLAQEDLLQKYEERVERLSQQNRVIKNCTDAGCLKTVEVRQYFMTKHTDEFSRFTELVTCREYTLPRDEKSTDPKGWTRGNTQIGPVSEVTTSHLQGKYGVEIRIESVNKDNSHSWVGISHGLNKLVTDLIDKEYDDTEHDETLCGYEDIVSSRTDHFTASVKVSPHEVLVQLMIDIQQIFATHQKGGLLHLLIQTVSTNILLPDQLCRRDSASTTGTLGPDMEKKMPSKNRLQGGGISLPCRRRPNMLIMTLLQVGST